MSRDFVGYENKADAHNYCVDRNYSGAHCDARPQKVDYDSDARVPVFPMDHGSGVVEVAE